MTDEIKNTELNDEELEEVCGGNFCPDYKSGPAPLFHRGDRVVICRIFDDTSYSKKVIKYSAIITKVSEKPFKDGQFAYNVRHKDGGDEFVLESELLHRQSDGIWVPFEP